MSSNSIFLERSLMERHSEAVAAFSALGHEHRLAVYRLLVEAGPQGLSAGVIAGRMSIPPSSLTFHTQALVRAGLVTQRRESRLLIYSADFSAMNALVAYLTENCCGGGAESCASVCSPETAVPNPVAKRSCA
jgi:ArsR family transcriptional regulator, arsenate/arsenite/antimonite-responsive transcriptional repressor